MRASTASITSGEAPASITTIIALSSVAVALASIRAA
jgi:hypothetical protein